MGAHINEGEPDVEVNQIVYPCHLGLSFMSLEQSRPSHALSIPFTSGEPVP